MGGHVPQHSVRLRKTRILGKQTNKSQQCEIAFPTQTQTETHTHTLTHTHTDIYERSDNV